jgi:prepilin-type N-terminal cleavage/methylation domain-containing protein
MLKRILKSSRGFTLIEVLVVVVIVAILAAISVPIYIQYVEGARASDAQATIGAIFNAAKMYRQDHSEDPPDIQILQDQGYLDIDESTLRQWEFAIIGADPIMQIQATSTPEMRGGEGHIVVYDVATGTFTGYGLPTEEGGE